MPGVEVLAHPFELGVRKAKEWMFTGDWLSAAEAERRGMVNHVVPRSELSAKALSLALKIAECDRFALKLMKESINAAEDAMGRREALKQAFSLHQIGHLQNMLRFGFMMNIEKLAPSVKSHLEASMAKAAQAGRPVEAKDD